MMRALATGRLDHAEYVREEEPFSQISHFEWQRGDSGDDIDAGGGGMRNHQVYTKRTDPKTEQTPGVHGSFDVVYDPFFFSGLY